MRRTGWAAAGTRFATPTIAVKVRSTAHRSKLECANPLKNAKISVFEPAPPMTSTPLFAGGGDSRRRCERHTNDGCRKDCQRSPSAG